MKNTLKTYLILLKHAYNAYDIKEDESIKEQIVSIYEKYIEIEKQPKIKKSVLTEVKLYLKDLSTFDRDIILENGNVILGNV